MRTPAPKLIARVVVLLLVIAVAVGAWTWWQSRRTAEDSGALTASGSVEAREYQVAPAASGTVTGVHVTEGQKVTKGTELVDLDAKAFRLQVEQAKQGVEAAQAAVTQAKDDDSGDAAIAAAQARVEQAKAAVGLAQVQQGYARVTAPAAGVVATLTTNVGQIASPARALLTIVDTKDLYVRAYVPETRIGDVKVGGKADVTTDSSATTYAGTVSYVSSTAEFTPNTVETADQRTKLVYEVRVRVADTSGTLKPGMPVDVTFR